MWSNPTVALVGILLLLAHAAPQGAAAAVKGAVKPAAVVGDECDSGQEFPVRIGTIIFVGCVEFAGANWCSRDDDSLELCPNLPITEGFTEMFGDISPKRKIKSSDGPLIVISETMIINDDESVVDEDGESADWIELFNASEEEINLEGWTMTDKEEKSQKWNLPAVEMAPGDYILIVASGKDRASDTSAHTNFKLSSTGEYLGIYRPDGTLSCGIDGEYPRQTVNVPYGIPDYDGSQDLADLEYTFLAEATPGDANSGVQESGPFVAGAHHTFEGGLLPVGLDLTVTALISENINEVAKATLIYRIMFGAPKKVTMKSDDANIFTATIPASKLKKGQLIQYYIQAVDSEGLKSRFPAFASEGWPEYNGVVVRDPALESSKIPTLYWFSSDPEQSASQDGFLGAVFYRGRYYDNVVTRKRGVTALTWAKPKIKFDFKGTVFKMKKGQSEVEEFNLQSFWDEPGEDSYMRETVAFQVMREAGVPACEAFHVRVNMNGEYYGLHAIIEQVDDVFLKKHGMSPSGPLFKSSHGELSNLRWDVKIGDIPWAYRKGNRPGVDDSEAMHNLIISLGGGGDISRSKFLYDHLNLPEIINYMAVSNMLLNQDRCTKNFYTYMHPVTKVWSVLPWDLEGAMGISNGLGGKPAPDYCTLACEQWNSPFYCDSQHPQDLIDVINIKIQSGRRLSFMSKPEPRRVSYRLPSAKAYDKDRTDGPSPSSAPGTYNHMDDAILSWGQTREMYLRRLRTLIDQFLEGRIQKIIKEQWKMIRTEAKKDNAVWEVTAGDIDNGYKQLITEQLPKRKAQLLEVYGPDGYGIIPESQPEDAQIQISAVEEDYVEIANPNKFAVDVSGWKLSGALDFDFIAGSVIPSKASVFVTPDIQGFRNREESPKGGMGLLIFGPSSKIAGSSVAITDTNGRTVAQS